MPTVSNVTQGKPATGGAVFRALLSDTLTLPENASDALSSEFLDMGYISEDGLTNTPGIEVENIKAWGGDIVLTPQTGKTDTWSFTLLESLNVNVLKAIYGESNVSGDLENGIAVASSSDEQEEAAWVFEQVQRGGVVLRTVIPDAKITEIGDVVYVDGEPVGYEITLTAMPDASGNTHYKYTA